MSTYENEFVSAFNHTMLYEVGPFWDPTDPEVQQGLIETKAQKRKVGYVNIPQDRGGETKYGLAQNGLPEINVRGLDLNEAMDVYYHHFWLMGKCDALPYPIALIHFDGCVNHGPGRAAKFLQKAVDVTADGAIGKMTLAAVEDHDATQVINSISEMRTDFYHSIVIRDSSQQIFLDGWMRRISEVTDYSLSLV